MACCDSANDVRYEDTDGDIFYFQVVDIDKEIEQDNYTRSGEPNGWKWIKNKDHYFLLVQQDQLLFKQLQNQELSSPDPKFKIETCRRNPQNQINRGKGKPVFMYAIKNDKYKLVCCNKEGKVHVDTRDSLPQSFKDTGDEGLFFLSRAAGCTNTFKLEPSLCQSHLLGFDSDANDRYLLKLAALRQPNDDVDVCYMTLGDF